MARDVPPARAEEAFDRHRGRCDATAALFTWGDDE